MQLDNPLQQLTADAVAAFLQARGWRKVAVVTPVGHGEWSRAFTFTEDASDFVVRFSTLDEDFRKDAIAARFSGPRLPMPRLVELGEAENGGFYAISERAGGTFIDMLDGAGMRAALPALLGAIDAMRLADISSLGGFGLWDATGNAPHATWPEALIAVEGGSRLDGWRERLEQSPTGAQSFDALLHHLTDVARDLPSPRHLIHADLLNYNVLVEGERVSAVLDWGSAMYGDWLYDVAWFVFWQPWYPAWAGIDFVAEARRHFTARGVELPEFAQRLKACQIAIGLGNQVYCAYRGETRWPQLAEVTRRTLAVVSA